MLQIILHFFISLSMAQQGPTIDAMAGAGIAARQPIDAAILNPAALASFEEYYAAMSFFRGKISSASMDQLGVTLADATEGTLLPGAFTYRYRRYSEGVDLREHFFRLGLAVPLFKNFTAGVAGYHLKTNLISGADYSQENVDLSFLWVLTPSLTWGGVTKGVLGIKKNASFLDSKIYPSSGTGLEYISELYRVRADLNYYHVNNHQQRFSHHLGLEIEMRGEFRLRGGWSVDDYHEENRYSAGLGWEGPRLKAAYTFQKEFRQGIGSSHSIDIWLHL